MNNNGRVIGTKYWARPIVVCKDAVYVHNNIKPVSFEEGSELYEYDEEVYDLEEYIVMLSGEVEQTKRELAQILEQKEGAIL